jgi:predicted 2-oxoglutarate/Fe(II)-dependent dioxygenase YbiX
MCHILLVMEFIYEIPNVLSKETCEELIERFLKDDKKHPSTVSGGQADHEVRKSTNLWIGPDNETWRDTAKDMFKIFIDGLDKYGHHLVDNNYITFAEGGRLFGKELRFESPFINQSLEGDYYHWHTDDFTKQVDKQRRSFSCLIYLSTLEEDQGGCTEFMIGKKVRPEQGKMLIFPSTWTYVHRAAEVKNGGVKYTLGTWVG